MLQKSWRGMCWTSVLVLQCVASREPDLRHNDAYLMPWRSFLVIGISSQFSHPRFLIISSSRFWLTRSFSGGICKRIDFKYGTWFLWYYPSYSLLLLIVDLAQPAALYKYKIQKWSLEYTKVRKLCFLQLSLLSKLDAFSVSMTGSRYLLNL